MAKDIFLNISSKPPSKEDWFGDNQIDAPKAPIKPTGELTENDILKQRLNEPLEPALPNVSRVAQTPLTTFPSDVGRWLGDTLFAPNDLEDTPLKASLKGWNRSVLESIGNMVTEELFTPAEWLVGGFPFPSMSKRVGHGAKELYQKFDPRKVNRGDTFSSQGQMHFAEDPSYAARGFAGGGEGGNLRSSALGFKNALDLMGDALSGRDIERLMEAGMPPSVAQSIWVGSPSMRTSILDNYQRHTDPKILQKAGYDALRYDDVGNVAYAIFDPNLERPVKILRPEPGRTTFDSQYLKREIPFEQRITSEDVRQASLDPLGVPPAWERYMPEPVYKSQGRVISPDNYIAYDDLRATIFPTLEDAQHYIKTGIFNPTKVKIDSVKSFVSNNPKNKWVTTSFGDTAPVYKMYDKVVKPDDYIVYNNKGLSLTYSKEDASMLLKSTYQGGKITTVKEYIDSHPEKLGETFSITGGGAPVSPMQDLLASLNKAKKYTVNTANKGLISVDPRDYVAYDTMSLDPELHHFRTQAEAQLYAMKGGDTVDYDTVENYIKNSPTDAANNISVSPDVSSYPAASNVPEAWIGSKPSQGAFLPDTATSNKITVNTAYGEESFDKSQYMAFNSKNDPNDPLSIITLSAEDIYQFPTTVDFVKHWNNKGYKLGIAGELAASDPSFKALVVDKTPTPGKSLTIKVPNLSDKIASPDDYIVYSFGAYPPHIYNLGSEDNAFKFMEDHFYINFKHGKLGDLLNTNSEFDDYVFGNVPSSKTGGTQNSLLKSEEVSITDTEMNKWLDADEGTPSNYSGLDPHDYKSNVYDLKAEDLDTFQKVGPQEGSNPGGVYEAPDGSLYYAKTYKNPEQAYGEAIANHIYNDIGLRAPKSKAVGNIHISDLLDDAVPIKDAGLTKARAEEILDGFGADVLLGNWDTVGLGLDNVVISNGKIYRVDQGGTLKFRAQGDLKPASALTSIEEVETFITKNPDYARVFELAGYKDANDIKDKIDVIVHNATNLIKPHGGWVGYLKSVVPETPEHVINELGGILKIRLDKLNNKFNQMYPEDWMRIK